MTCRGDDATQLRAHLRKLMTAGMSMAAIDEAAMVSVSTTFRVLREGRRPLASTVERLLAVPTSTRTRRHQPSGWVPAVGTKRRLQALLAIGWTRRDLTDRLGIGVTKVLQSRRRHVELDTHAAVIELYRRLATTPGPSPQVMIIALTLDYAPPLAWAGLDMDDPTARPRDAATPDGGSAEALRLIRGGRSLADAAAAVGVQVSTITRAGERSTDPALRRLVADAARTARLDGVAS